MTLPALLKLLTSNWTGILLSKGIFHSKGLICGALEPRAGTVRAEKQKTLYYLKHSRKCGDMVF